MTDETLVDEFDPNLTSGAENDAPEEQPDEQDVPQAAELLDDEGDVE